MLQAVLSSPAAVRTTLLLTFSNVFMTFAWYAHLRDLKHRVWYVAALVSWGIALFYMRRILSIDDLWACLCLCGAAFFLFRNSA